MRSDLGQSGPAIAALDRALTLDGADRGALLARGVAKGRAGDLTGALADLDTLIALDPNSVVGHLNRGIALMQAGRFADAVSALQRAVKLDDSVGPAHLQLGQALAKVGRKADAAREFARATQLGVDPSALPAPDPTGPSGALSAAQAAAVAAGRLLLNTQEVSAALKDPGTPRDGSPPAVPALCSGTVAIVGPSAGRRWNALTEGVWQLASPAAANQALARVQRSLTPGCTWKLTDGSLLELDGSFVVQPPGSHGIGFALRGIGGDRGEFTALGAVIISGSRLAYLQIDGATLDGGVRPLRQLAGAAAQHLG